ncbi:MAG: type II secretion system F family protein [Candidatus Aenigmarchaeota archaeon]|nr:type II secretion system F family protein [Candidatus Aenigmarchaeota archaeon]
MLNKIAFKYFGGIVKPYLKHFDPLREGLVKADMRVSIHEYVSNMVFVSFMIMLVGWPTVSLLLGLAFGYAQISSVALAVTMSFTLSLVLSSMSFAAMYYYPSLSASSRKRKIENSLPFGTMYMATIASSGAPPTKMFKIISDFSEFGELSREVSRIYTDTEIFGMDVKTALQKASERTPSEKFKDLLWGLSTIITTGGSMSEYLHEKSKSYMADFRRSIKDYSEQMSLYIEMYITLIIVGSVFFLILSAVMTAISPTSSVISIQFFVIFIFLPMISVGFIFLSKGISPTEE